LVLPYRPIWPNVYSDPNGQGGTFYLKARPKAGPKAGRQLADSWPTAWSTFWPIFAPTF